MFEEMDIKESEPELAGKIKEQKAKMVAEKSQARKEALSKY